MKSTRLLENGNRVYIVLENYESSEVKSIISKVFNSCEIEKSERLVNSQAPSIEVPKELSYPDFNKISSFVEFCKLVELFINNKSQQSQYFIELKAFLRKSFAAYKNSVNSVPIRQAIPIITEACNSFAKSEISYITKGVTLSEFLKTEDNVRAAWLVVFRDRQCLM